MNANSYIKLHQALWARRKKIDADSQGYVADLKDNLFEEFTEDVRKEFESADGAELRPTGEGRAKMQALHSSSALALNVFHYWKNRPNKEPLAEVLSIPSRDIASLAFEKKLPVSDAVDRALFPRDPNIDVVLEYTGRSDKLKAVGIESKFSEAYGQHEGLRDAYFQDERLWNGLSACYKLALDMRGKSVTGLNTPQLLKHVLALKNHAMGGKFWLLYIWYGTPTIEMGTHFSNSSVFSRQSKLMAVAFITSRIRK